MLSPEKAQAQLQEIRKLHPQPSLCESVSSLSPQLRPLAYRLMGYDSQGNPLNWKNFTRAQENLAAQLSQLPPLERLSIFHLFFPRFAPTVEKAWQLFSRLPYQNGHLRRGFRAPHHPEVSDTNRLEWLKQLIQIPDTYSQDLPWLAAWAPYLNYYSGDSLGILFAAAIEQGDAWGEEVFSILVASARGEHEIGAMGRHVSRALLVAARPEGWEVMENLLRASQRQEGLRQVILETIDEAHPQALSRMLKLIVAEDFTRFSATVRAADVWFGLGWESVNRRLVTQALAQVSLFLAEPATLYQALEGEEPENVYLALWALAFQDAFAAIPVAANLLNHQRVEYRFVAVHLLNQLLVKESKLAVIPALEDGDLRVATHALNALINPVFSEVKEANLFEVLQSVINRFPQKAQELKYLVWNWINIKSSQSLVTTALLNSLGKRSPQLLIPYLPKLEVHERQKVARLLIAVKPWNEEIRTTIFKLISDPSQWVRGEVIKALSGCQIAESEIIILEKLLTRKSADLRRGILQLILQQNHDLIINSAQRLLNCKPALQHLAGLEILREMKDKNLCLESCLMLAKAYQSQGKTLPDEEIKILDLILETELKEPTLEDALGLINLEDLSPYTPPELKGNYRFATQASQASAEALDALLEISKHTPIQVENLGQAQEELLGNLQYFPLPDSDKTVGENLLNFPLAELWQNWERDRPNEQRDPDGLELIRGAGTFYINLQRFSDSGTISWLESPQTPEWGVRAWKTLFIDTSSLRYPRLISSILLWLIYLSPPEGIINFLLDAAAQTLLLIPDDKLKSSSSMPFFGWEITNALLGWFQLLRSYRYLSLSSWSGEQHFRYWQLQRALEKSPNLAYFQPSKQLEDLVLVYRAGRASEADIIAHLVAEEKQTNSSNPFEEVVAEINPHLFGDSGQSRRNFIDLAGLTARKLPPNLDPILKELGDRVRQRILEVELQRGDLATAATAPALALRSVTGIATLSQLLRGMEREKLVRGYIYGNTSKAAVFSYLIRVSFPGVGETPQDFAAMVQREKIPVSQLIELAFYAPQWTNYVEYTLGWAGFTEGVWWIHAHTKDNNWYVDAEVREEWKVQVSEKTPLGEQNLIDGAVDVAWFWRIYTSLEQERWQQLFNAAKYGASGAGHKRAQLFAEAMLGQVERATLINRLRQKRHQDAVRALGLLPLQGEADLLERYQILQEFLRTSRQFGSQKQASEKLAVTIGLENLARTAEYVDPQRLEWAMEALAIADLQNQPQEVCLGDVTVTLSLQRGKAEISISKQGKALKTIPAKLKKEPALVELQNRKQEINRQEKRMRLSLEQAMLRGDKFSRAELAQLYSHPILAPLLEQLIFVGTGEIGYLTAEGRALSNYGGTIEEIKSDFLQIAHPYELLQTQAWHLWQSDCFSRGYRQPFKQIFRELYVLTPTEISQHNHSRRYEGQQINPKMALALWGQRGWITCPEEGVRKTFHEANLSVWVTFAGGFYTPLEMEGLTLEGVYFTQRGDWQPLSLNAIPPKIFSEVMRDLDLVVSVAHLGGIDPEASASTLEMRAALIRESCRLLKLENVALQDSHALISGNLADYSLHLGSGIIHRQPGGALCIIPVHSQHRGRLFLPFADDDPKTAEVMSKVILLAKDQEIKDPTILAQILPR